MSEQAARKDLYELIHKLGRYQAPGTGESIDRFFERNVVIPKADLPKVTQSANGDPNSYRTDGENVVFTSVENARMWTMRDIAVWQFIEAKEAKAAEANAALAKRRDELADEFTAVRTYGGQLPYTQRLIDRIIELEDARK